MILRVDYTDKYKNIQKPESYRVHINEKEQILQKLLLSQVPP